MKIPNESTVNFVRNNYPEGTRVELVYMDDIQAPPAGTKGTVLYVDDMADIGIEWDDGSCLAAVYGIDYIRRI